MLLLEAVADDPEAVLALLVPSAGGLEVSGLGASGVDCLCEAAVQIINTKSN